MTEIADTVVVSMHDLSVVVPETPTVVATETPVAASTETPAAAPTETVREKDDGTGPVFFSKTIARWVKKNTGDDTRTTPEARDLIRQILEQDTAELCRKSYQVAHHARGASSGARKRKAQSVVRVMPKDLDLVLSIMKTEQSPIAILSSKIEDQVKPKKRVKKTTTIIENKDGSLTIESDETEVTKTTIETLDGTKIVMQESIVEGPQLENELNA